MHFFTFSSHTHMLRLNAYMFNIKILVIRTDSQLFLLSSCITTYRKTIKFTKPYSHYMSSWTYRSNNSAVARPDNSSGCNSCKGIWWDLMRLVTWKPNENNISCTPPNLQAHKINKLGPQRKLRAGKIINHNLPICWGYETFSGGLVESARLAMLMPHLKVGAQKWTNKKRKG